MDELKQYIEKRIEYISNTKGKMRAEAYELGYLYEKFIVEKADNKDELRGKIKSLIER